jgi:hypothetical protein
MLRTRSGLPKFCSWATDRHGKARVRFRRRGFTCYISGIPWSPSFMEAYGKALEGVQLEASNVGASRTLPGSINALIVSYYSSPEFRGLKASTAAVRRNIIEAFRREHGDKPVARLVPGSASAILCAWAGSTSGASASRCGKKKPTLR